MKAMLIFRNAVMPYFVGSGETLFSSNPRIHVRFLPGFVSLGFPVDDA